MQRLRQGAPNGSRPAAIRRWALLIGGWVLCSAGVFLVGTYVLAQSVAYSDFTNDYRAAEALLSGDSIYAATNAHPPFTALLLVPFTWLPYRYAYLLWSLCSICFYLFCLASVIQSLRIRVEAHWVPLLLGAMLCWYPFVAHIALGQVSLLLAMCIIVGWQALRRGHDRLAGGVFGFAAAVKLYPALFGLHLLLRRRWKALGAMALTALGCSLLPLVSVAPEDYVAYLTKIAPENAARYAAFPANASITGVVSRLFVDGPWVEPLADAPGLARGLIAALSLVVLWGLVRRLRRLPPTPTGEGFALAYVCLCMILLSPISWQHAFVLLMLPFGLVVQAQQNQGSARLRVCKSIYSRRNGVSCSPTNRSEVASQCQEKSISANVKSVVARAMPQSCAGITR